VRKEDEGLVNRRLTMCPLYFPYRSETYLNGKGMVSSRSQGLKAP